MRKSGGLDGTVVFDGVGGWCGRVVTNSGVGGW